MHLEEGSIPVGYKRYIGGKITLIVAGFFILAALIVVSISIGSARMPLREVLQTLFLRHVSEQLDSIVFNIRLPQTLTAIVAGAGLSIAGAVMQSVLENPLASPFTLGISHAAAFGAALSVMAMGSRFSLASGTYALNALRAGMTAGTAFLTSMIATLIVILISNLRRGSPEVMALAGVALGSLFTAGTMFLQYFADDVELAAMVFWTFGDVGRANWSELGIISAVTGGVILFFLFNAWNYNAIDAGDETALGLGVSVRYVRFFGMFFASLVTAVTIAFVGVIGFVGLICPHMVRRLIGDDNRFLLPGSCVMGSILLLAADTTARMIMAPRVLPVAILTSFVGAPVFLYLIIKGNRR
ncbi:FecCD family ABC transporter permease [Acetomicrobium sp. S15 = DSM 107314]|jgi:iron complex transport system permease protein|uniref:FecCD family ABC transporter permease n=1 Tax=Acetomicrobium sp. S15 = DSM 107314 TaxID=2529858 RepID=UPI0018E16004|nr:iron ABC transporter permease [Acetomicrobium sp. S15 = DSM 107314]